MARNQETVTCKPGVWTELTNSDTSKIGFQGNSGIEIKGTVLPIAPTTGNGWRYKADLGEADRSLASLFNDPNVKRVFAKPLGNLPVQVVVDHA